MLVSLDDSTTIRAPDSHESASDSDAEFEIEAINMTFTKAEKTLQKKEYPIAEKRYIG